MKSYLAASRLLLVCVVFLDGVNASAMTLGRLGGAAVLGQPLQVTVPVQYGAGEDITASCFQAEVLYGDVKQESQGVSLGVETRDDGQPAMVRVRSANRVDEPVVTVTLRAGCEQRISRRYVLLADLPTGVTPALAQEPLRETSSSPRGQAPATSAAPMNPLAASGSSPAPAPASVGVALKPEVRGASEDRVERPKRPVRLDAGGQLNAAHERRISSGTRESKSQSRLKLAPWELGPEKDPVLKSSDSLLFLEPLENLEKRAQAVAAWRALNIAAEDVVRQETRDRAVDADLKTLQELTVRNQQALAEITGRLQQAEAQRYANPLVYVLVILLLVIGTVALLLWNRMRDVAGHTGPWWRGMAPLSADPPPLEDVGVAYRPTQMETVAAAPLPGSTVEIHQQRVAAPQEVGVLMGEPVFGGLSAQAAEPLSSQETVLAAAHAEVAALQDLPETRSEFKDFGPSVSGVLRAINTGDMLDVRQRADFFMTLGQYEEAISALTESIKTSEFANPMVYLDLLKIFHTLSRKEDFDGYRDEFNQEFTGSVPVYVGFNRWGMPLESYPDIIERIEALWPTEQCADYIESCLVRNPADPPESGLDLEAFCDLLMLHGMVQRLDSLSESTMVPFSAVRQVPAHREDIAVTTMLVQTQSDLESLTVDLDLDLNQTPGNNLIDFDVSGLSNSRDLPKDP